MPSPAGILGPAGPPLYLPPQSIAVNGGGKVDHFHGSVVVEQKINPAVVSQRLGHANPTITMKIYAHALPGWQQQTADDVALIMAESQNGLDRQTGDETTDTVAA